MLEDALIYERENVVFPLRFFPLRLEGARSKYGHDPVAYYLHFHPGKTRGFLKFWEPGLYALLYRRNLLALVPCESLEQKQRRYEKLANTWMFF